MCRRAAGGCPSTASILAIGTTLRSKCDPLQRGSYVLDPHRVPARTQSISRSLGGVVLSGTLPVYQVPIHALGRPPEARIVLWTDTRAPTAKKSWDWRSLNLSVGPPKPGMVNDPSILAVGVPCPSAHLGLDSSAVTLVGNWWTECRCERSPKTSSVMSHSDNAQFLLVLHALYHPQSSLPDTPPNPAPVMAPHASARLPPGVVKAIPHLGGGLLGAEALLRRVGAAAVKHAYSTRPRKHNARSRSPRWAYLSRRWCDGAPR